MGEALPFGCALAGPVSAHAPPPAGFSSVSGGRRSRRTVAALVPVVARWRGARSKRGGPPAPRVENVSGRRRPRPGVPLPKVRVDGVWAPRLVWPVTFGGLDGTRGTGCPDTFGPHKQDPAPTARLRVSNADAVFPGLKALADGWSQDPGSPVYQGHQPVRLVRQRLRLSLAASVSSPLPPACATLDCDWHPLTATAVRLTSCDRVFLRPADPTRVTTPSKPRPYRCRSFLSRLRREGLVYCLRQ